MNCVQVSQNAEGNTSFSKIFESMVQNTEEEYHMANNTPSTCFDVSAAVTFAVLSEPMMGKSGGARTGNLQNVVEG